MVIPLSVLSGHSPHGTVPAEGTRSRQWGQSNPQQQTPVQGAVCVGTASALQQSHHHFLPPGFKIRKEDASPGYHYTSCLGLLEAQRAPAPLNIHAA